MKHLKIDVMKMLADVAVMPMKERGEYISEVLRQARCEENVTYDWVQAQIDVARARAAAGSKGGSKPKEKKEKPQRKRVASKAEKKRYAPDVLLFEAEYEKLVTQHSKSTADLCIKILQEYKSYKERQGQVVDYASDYAAINKWVLDKARKQEHVQRSSQVQSLRLEKVESPEEFTPVDF